MTPLSAADRERLNDVQRRYYAGPPRPSMTPRLTPYVARHLETVIQGAGLTAADRILEVGCGMGRFTIPLAARGLSVEGLDLSPVLLARLREYNHTGRDIPLHCLDILDLAPETLGTFDAIVGFFVLHHLHDVPACVAALARLLRPGGRMAFLEPNPRNPLYHLQIVFTRGMSYRGERSIFQMTRRVLFPAMAGTGLVDLRLTRYGFFPPFLANRPLGRKWEDRLERLGVLRPLLPFQVFSGHLP